MKGYIYLIESVKNFNRYCGSTINPTKRIRQHNNGEVKATKKGIPWKCLLIICIGNITEAKKIEYYIKRQKEKLTIRNIIKILNRYFENMGR